MVADRGTAHAIQALRVFLNRDPEALSALLRECVEAMQVGARCVVVCLSPWELAALRQFLRDFEAPSARVMAGAVPPGRLCDLYPLLGTGKSFAVRRVGSALKPKHGESEAAWTYSVHTFEKVSFVPGSFAVRTPSARAPQTRPPEPFFGVKEEKEEGAEPEAAEPESDPQGGSICDDDAETELAEVQTQIEVSNQVSNV